MAEGNEKPAGVLGRLNRLVAEGMDVTVDELGGILSGESRLNDDMLKKLSFRPIRWA